MNAESSQREDSLPIPAWQEIDRICDDFESAWRNGQNPCVDDYVHGSSQPVGHELRRQLKKIDREYQTSVREQPIPEHYVRQLVESGVLTSDQAQAIDVAPALGQSTDHLAGLARELCRRGMLTEFQAQIVCRGMGHRLAVGSYIVLEAIGRGGMGYVYKARHRRLNRIVALKTLPKEARQSRDAVRRFEREIETLGKLSHPNIVAAHDAFEANGAHFLVMEYVPGVGLPSLIRMHGPLSVPQAVGWTLQAARGLEYAHRQGIIHRDVKPTNLLCDGANIVKVLDLGLVRVCGPEVAVDRGLTNCDQAVGTADYMSPEQALDPRKADARSDIYSLGCTLHYLLTGRAVFGGDTWAQKILEHRDQPIPLLRASRDDVPERLDTLFRRMLAKRPEERQQTMDEAVLQLEQLEVPAPQSLVPIENRPDSEDPLQDTAHARAGPMADTVVNLSARLDLDSPLFCDSPQQVRASHSHSEVRVPAGSGRLNRTRWMIIMATIAVAATLGLLALIRNWPSAELSGDIKFLDPVDGVVDDDFLACLEDFAQPVYLDLSAQPITDQGLRYLVQANVVGLVLKGTSIGDSGLKHLRNAESLVTLNLADTRVTDEGLRHLSQLSQLDTLDLSGTAVEGVGLDHLKEVASLKTLILAGANLTDEGCETIGQLGSLDSLDIRHTAIGDRGLKRLAAQLPACDIRADVPNPGTEMPASRQDPGAER